MRRFRRHGIGRSVRIVAMLVAAWPAVSQAWGQAVRITCGGARTDYAATDGKVWQTDRYFTGGDAGYSKEDITNTAELYLYRTTRYGLWDDFSYRIPVANGSYTLTLKFAEWRFWNRGERVFHVVVNGTRVLSDFDILAEAPPRSALDKQFPVTVTNGAVVIQFQGVVNFGTLSALSLEPSAVTISVDPAQASLTAGKTQQFSAAVSGATNTAVTWSASAGTITASGLYTAPAAISTPGAATVTATSVADPARKATATVELKTPVVLAVNPTSGSVSGGLTLQMQANVTGTTDTRVTWSASAGSISSSGLFTAPQVTTPAVATITARSVADPTVTAISQITVNPAMPAEKVYLESSGQVAMEAENGAIVERAHKWVPGTTPAGSSGAAALTALPNSGTNYSTSYAGVSPEAQYRVKFSAAGTYYVWVRGYSTGPADDSIHLGLNGSPVASGATLSQYPRNAWAWSNQKMDNTGRVILAVPSAGTHTVNVWMREDGFTMDKLVLTTSASFTPQGVGPAESPVETGGPVMSLSTENLGFSYTGGAAPAAQSVQVSNIGAGTMNWTATGDRPWLAIAPASGTNDGAMGVTANAAGLAPGNYTGSITVSCPLSAGSPKKVNVTLSVAAAVQPSLTVSPASLSFSATAGGSNPASRSLTIGNDSGGSLNWTASSNQQWLSVSPQSGTAPGSASVAVNIAGLAAGTYSGAITVTSSGSLNSPQTVNVTLTVAQGTTTQPPPATTGRQWYVTPGGTASGDGSMSRPWSLAAALAGPSSVRPGDTIWVRGGTYGTNSAQTNSRLAGTAAAPITVRAYPGERATILGGLAAYSPYTWYWGLEITNTNSNRTSSRGGSACMDIYDSAGIRVINMILHDCDQGIGFWRAATGSTEAHGNVIYYNGYQDGGTDRGHGHGIYTQNISGNPRVLSDNIIFDQFGLGIQAYGSSSTYVQDITTEGNILFNNGSISRDAQLVDNILFAGGAFLDRITVKDNYTYHTTAAGRGYSRLGWPWSEKNGTLVSTGNYWVNGAPALEVWNWDRATFTGNTVYSASAGTVVLKLMSGQSAGNYTWDGNRYYGSGKFTYGSTGCSFASWKSATGKDGSSTYSSGAPAGVWAFARPNKYETGRGNVVVYNWARQNAVEVNVSSILKAGAQYEVRDAQNFFGSPIVTGTYNGGTISIPMTGTAKARPVGSVPNVPAHTGMEFGAFVILTR